MTAAFADTHFFLALANPDDDSHARAVQWSESARSPAVTTEWVLAELGNGLREPHNRQTFLGILAKLRSRPDFEIVPASSSSFERGVRMFGERLDKCWSVTDCISFVVMQDRGIREALTGDHHFEQAEFVALLR